MKWLSIRKYKPYSSGVECIILNKYGIFIASLEENDGNWMDSEGKHFDLDSFPTHFCIPDAVEVDE
jgi:hypothetical protein